MYYPLAYCMYILIDIIAELICVSLILGGNEGEWHELAVSPGS